VAFAVVDSHLHVWDETAAGFDPGPMKIGYSAQATASVEFFMDYMREADVDRAVFVHVLAGCGDVRNRNLLPREATFLSKEQLDLVMGGTAERLWFG